MTVDRRARRAIIVGGPADGTLLPDHRPDPDGTIVVPAFDDDLLQQAIAGDWTPDGSDRWTTCTYVGHTLRDLDGTLLTVYSPQESRRPDLSLWKLARDVAALRMRKRAAEKREHEADEMARRALRKADQLAGELQRLRADEAVLRDRLAQMQGPSNLDTRSA